MLIQWNGFTIQHLISRELLLGPEIEGKLRVTSLFYCLLMGPVEVGNTFIGRPGILQMILAMANSEEYLQQVSVHWLSNLVYVRHLTDGILLSSESQQKQS